MAPTELYWLEDLFPPDLLSMAGRLIDYLQLERIHEAEWDYQRWALARAWKQRTNYNPLTILTRAMNGLYLRLCSIRQPCWRATRWKSLT